MWYYITDDLNTENKIHGPVSLDELVNLLENNKINDKTLIQKEGTAAWQYIDIVPEVMIKKPVDIEGLVSAYLAACDMEKWPDELWWAWEKMDRLISYKPEVAWEVILQLIHRAFSEKIIGLIAAGPLEELLAQHGEAFIKQVEEMARKDERFCFCLAGVWQNAISASVWQRVVKAVGNQRPTSVQAM